MISDQFLHRHSQQLAKTARRAPFYSRLVLVVKTADKYKYKAQHEDILLEVVATCRHLPPPSFLVFSKIFLRQKFQHSNFNVFPLYRCNKIVDKKMEFFPNGYSMPSIQIDQHFINCVT